MPKRADSRYCCCGCGQLAANYRNETGRNKGWRAYARGHAPNEAIEIRIPDSAIDIAYAAGIVDGEGCFYARVLMTKTSINTILCLKVSMCSEAVIQWLHDRFGGEIYFHQPKGSHKKLQYSWQVRGKKTINITTALLPYLKEKRKRAELAIELARLIESNNNQHLDALQISERTRIATTIKSFNRLGEDDPAMAKES